MVKLICTMPAIMITVGSNYKQVQILFVNYIKLNILKIFLDGIWAHELKKELIPPGSKGLAKPYYEKVIDIAIQVLIKQL